MTPVQIYSTAVLALVAIGVSLRRTPKFHIPVMLSAFALDLGSVLYLEFARHAVEKAISKPRPILMVHIPFAFSTVVLYIAMTATGTRLLRTGKGRAVHKALAVAFLICRTGTWATSFLVV